MATCLDCPPPSGDCDCPIKDLSTDCVLYPSTGLNLTHIGVAPQTILTQALENINTNVGAIKDLIGNVVIINVGAGEGLFKQVNNIGQREFKSIVAGSNVSLTSGTDDITIAVAQATDSVAGVIEIATQAEVSSGTDTTRAVTPATLNAVLTAGNFIPNASTTVRGIVELATVAEAQAGVDTVRAVTPAGLAAALAGGSVPDASTTVKGIVELATGPEVQAGTDSTRAVTTAALVTRTATETRTGLAEIATQAEVTAGTDDQRIVTPLKLKNELDAVVPTNTSELVNDGDGVNNFATVDQLPQFLNKSVILPYTITNADKGAVLYTSGSGNITVPSGLDSEFECGVVQQDAGPVTIAGSGTTIRVPSGLTTTMVGQYHQIYIRRSPGSQVYNVFGNLQTV